MEDDEHPSEQENVDPQADSESISHFDEDVDVSGSNFEYNHKDTKMVVVDKGQRGQVQHYNDVEPFVLIYTFRSNLHHPWKI